LSDPTGQSHGVADLGPYANLLPSTITKNLFQFKLAQGFTEAEVAHWFLRKPTIVPRISEGPRIRASEEADAGDIAPTKTGIGRGSRAKTNRETFDRLKTKLWEILDHLGEPWRSFHRRSSDGRVRKFRKEEWLARHSRVWRKIQMTLNGCAPKQTVPLIPSQTCLLRARDMVMQITR
jgi:hypothetical protein